jgi:parallel beta-helix repeat protein
LIGVHIANALTPKELFLKSTHLMLAFFLVVCGTWGHAKAAPADPDPLPGTVNLPPAEQTAPYYRCVRDWYVDVVIGSDGNSGNSASKPYRTIGKATRNSKLTGGDCIHVAPGTYFEFVWPSHGGTFNSTDGYVVLISAQRWGAKIVGPPSNGYSVVTLQSSYVVVDGFDVSGGANGGHCIDGGYDSEKNHAHHLVVINNNIHDCGGGGIELAGGDYYIVEGNVASQNATTSLYQTSGISIAAGFDVAGSFTRTQADDVYYHNIIRNNISHDNFERFSCSANNMPNACHTDGNGIIVDYYHPGGYPHRTLVTGNVVFGNGGSGIQVGRSDNVIVANNTAYNNYLDHDNSATARGELANIASSNTVWVNNIAWSVPGRGVLADNTPILDLGSIEIAGIKYTGSHVLWENNITFGADPKFYPPGFVDPAHNQIGFDPRLKSVAAGVFTLRLDSPASAAGLPEGFLESPTPNIGAY